MATHQATNIQTTANKQQSLQSLNAWIASPAANLPHGFNAAQINQIAPDMMLYHQHTGRIAKYTFPPLWNDQICGDFLGAVRGIFPTNNVIPIWVPGHPSSRPVFQVGVIKPQTEIHRVWRDSLMRQTFTREEFDGRAGEPVFVHLGIPFAQDKLAYLDTITPFDIESNRLPEQVIKYTHQDKDTFHSAIIAEQDRVDGNIIRRAATLNARYLAYHAAATVYVATMNGQAVAMQQITNAMSPVPLVPANELESQMLSLDLVDHNLYIHEMYEGFNQGYAEKEKELAEQDVANNSDDSDDA